jgi:hypothetical protein
MASEFFGTNVHKVERVVRVVVGLGALSLVVAGPQSLWGLLGLVPLLTGIAGTCPLYSVLGISTCSRRAVGN